ncbi:hypothetical protein N9383_00895 [Granulosicoccus sp.]|nr:hypothetical protein [Granulosicoccus sp.]
MSTNARQDRLQSLYSDRWITRLKSFVARRYHDFGDWEGWFEEAHQNLALKIDAMPEDQEINDALVFAVFKNELISVKRNRLGYPRPRAWLRQFSELGQDLFEWMCLQKLPRDKIIAMAEKRLGEKAYVHITAANEASNAAEHKKLLVQLTDTMIKKKECDGTRPSITSDINDDAVVQIASDTPSVEEETDHAQLELMLSMILGTDTIDDATRDQAAERIEAIKRALQDQPLLDDIDILIVRCYYFQGMSQNDVAKLVKLPLQRVVRKREAAIKRIRQFLEAHGLTREAFGL